MSIVAVMLIAGGALAIAYFIWFLVAGFETPVGTFERWHAQKHANPKGPEPGTIRIVENLDEEDGTPFYYSECYDREFGLHGDSFYDWHTFVPDRLATVVDAQAAASEKAERYRRKNYSKVRGEFKP